MRTFSEGFRSFKEGLDWRLISDYWRAVREHAWEIFWGAGVPGVVVTIYTLYYSPARAHLPWVIAWAVLISGYYVWRPDHIRLMRKMGLSEPLTVQTTTNVPNLNRRFVQIPVNTLSEARLENCGGQLLRVWKWVDGGWQPTEVDEPLDLNWSILDTPVTFLDPEVPRRLNLLFVENTNRGIHFASDRVPFRMAFSSSPSECFKFDVRVSAQDCSPEHFSVKVTFGESWNELAIEKL